MKIKKTYQGVIPNNKIVNTSSTSKTDTYSCDYTNKLHSYSTEEQVIGKWIDGKPLYRKVFTGIWGAITDGTNTNIEIPIQNLDILARSTGVNVMSEGNSQQPFFMKNKSGYEAQAYYYNGNVRIRSNDAQHVGATYYVTIEYTKTTDTEEV